MKNMSRRHLLKHGAQAALLTGALRNKAIFAETFTLPLKQPDHKPMALGLLISPFPSPEEKIKLVHDLGFPTCFLSLDGYLGKYTTQLAQQFADLLTRYQVVATAAEVVHPTPLKWNFLEGPSTIGLVPRAYREARLHALMQTSDFAKMLGIGLIQTHCGFIPEDPHDPLYEETVLVIRKITDYCAANGQLFLMETGQETLTTMLRTIRDVDRPTLGVGLDTANLILYGKANPVDALKMLGPHVKAMHAKDGKWPTDPKELGKEVAISEGDVDFPRVLQELHSLGYTGAVSIEREISGARQIEDVKAEKVYLERILKQLK